MGGKNNKQSVCLLKDGTTQQSVENSESPSTASQNEEKSGEASQRDVSARNKEDCDETGGASTEEVESDQDKSGDGGRRFVCHACVEFFPTRSALAVHYKSDTHVLRMRTGMAIEEPAPSIPVCPFLSNKPYQCGVCRVSYNHAISLESHLKSVLHQSRTRSAGNAASNGVVVPTNPFSAQTASKDNDLLQGQATSALLSPPVSSAQAVSAFLTLLTSGPNPGVAPQILSSQPQMLMPLILNGLQAQNPSPEFPKQVLQQAVPVLGLSPAQQAILAQGLGGLQGQWAGLRLSGVAQVGAEDAKEVEVKVESNHEPSDQQVPQMMDTDLKPVKNEVGVESDTNQTDGQGDLERTDDEANDVDKNPQSSPCPSYTHKLAPPEKGPPTNIKVKGAKTHPDLSEFQTQVLWAFLESRSETDFAIPPKEDCEALGREVGLTENEVRKWLTDARNAKKRQAEGEPEEEEEVDEEVEVEDYEDESMEDEEGALMIDEGDDGGQSPSTSSSQAIDLSGSADRHKGARQPGLCLTSDSESEDFYTSVIVTDEESQSSSVMEDPASPAKETPQTPETPGGGKVLRSTTVFLSDAEDEDEDEQTRRRKKRKREDDKEELECKKEKPDSDLDLQLEAQADPPTPISLPLDSQGLPTGILHSLPLSLSLTPFSTQLFSPYVLSVPNVQSLAQTSQNGAECESALDLSMGKNQSPATPAMASKSFVQKTALLDGLGLKPTAVGVQPEGGLIVVQVKPDSGMTVANSSGSALENCNSLAKASTVYMRAAEKVNASLMARERQNEHERARDLKRPNAKRFRDMRRSRTIIQADQLDILYGCYFKDPNPGKHEFEQISEWVHLPKKVVQIWFQNMRARERKGEVRFISDGTLAAVGKPLIKFTWPLSKPIFSSTPKSNSSPTTPSVPPAKPPTSSIAVKIAEVKDPVKIAIQGLTRAKEVPLTAGTPSALKTKVETLNTYTMVKIAPKTVAPLVTVPILANTTPASQPAQKTSAEEQNKADSGPDKEPRSQNADKPGATNRTVPKLSPTPIVKTPIGVTQKQNGITYWSQKGPIKINTLSREQLGLSTPRPAISPAPLVAVSPASASATQRDSGYSQHSTPRRPRTHLNCLQLSILQSCYETCAHPNALECEAVGTALGLPLKVVQIWFQNTRAKEKRWRLQQERVVRSCP